jgi:hypothetical protein
MRIVLTESQYSKLLVEGKLEDLIKKYENDLGDKFYGWYKNQIEEFYEEDPSPTKKYFTWMSKILIDRDIKGLNTDEYNLIEMIKYFDKNIHKFEKKDIYQYTYEELINKYEQAISKVTKKELETSGVEKLYGDESDRYILVRPKNKEASCKYGANTKWCIASTSSNYFDNYSNDSLFFFVIDRERIPIEGKRKSEAYFKVAIQYNPEKHLKWDQFKSKEWKDAFLQQSQSGIFRFWNAVDDEVTSGTVTKYIPKELITKFIKLIKEYTYKVYLDYYDRMQQSSSTFDKKRLAELKKLVKQKDTERDKKWSEWVYSESNNFVEKVVSQYQDTIDFAEKYNLTPKSFDDFLRFMNIEERYEQEYKKDKELEKIYQQSQDEYIKLKVEFDRLEKESKAFKERISFRG